MKKILKVVAVILLLGTFIGLFIIKYIIMKSVEDLSDRRPEKSLTTARFLLAIDENDTVFLKSFNNKISEINGPVKEVVWRDSTASLIIGDSVSENTILCQMDMRHLFDVYTIRSLQTVRIKGIGSGFLSDDLGLGNSMQFKNCVITNK